jgi:hypothetical protein
VQICVIRGKTEPSPRISRIDTKRENKKTFVQIRGVRGKEKVSVRIRGVRGKTTGDYAWQI